MPKTGRARAVEVAGPETRVGDEVTLSAASPPAPPGAAADEAAMSLAADRFLGGVEAVLLSLEKPIAAQKLAEALGVKQGDGEGRSPGALVEDAIDQLNAQYEETGRAFRIERVAGGFRAMTLPAYADVVAAFHAARSNNRLSRAALETLAIVAYRQPVTRAELESIRGVACGEVLRTLLDRRLLAIVGRAEELGRPMLYGTSKRFLEVFGLASIRDLPAVGDLALRGQEEPDSSASPASEAE